LKDVPVIRSSKKHLEEADETYFEHCHAALTIALRLAAASAACALHALVPGLCTKVASRSVAELNRTLASRSAAFRQLAAYLDNPMRPPPHSAIVHGADIESS
jgi:hypothetical protein